MVTTNDIDPAFRQLNVQHHLTSLHPLPTRPSRTQSFDPVPSQFNHRGAVFRRRWRDHFRSRSTQTCLVDSPLASCGGCLTANFRKSAAITKDPEELPTSKPPTDQPPTLFLMTQPTAKGRQHNQQLVKQALSRESRHMTPSSLHRCYIHPTPKGYAKRTTALASFGHCVTGSPTLSRVVGCGGVIGVFGVETQTEVDGKVLGVLQDAISALLGDRRSSSSHRYGIHGCFIFADAPSASCTNRYPQSRLFSLFTVAPTLDPPTRFGNTTSRNAFFLGSLDHGNPVPGANLYQKGSGDPRRRRPVGRDVTRKGPVDGHGSEGVAEESNRPGYDSLAETAMVRLKFFSTWTCLLIGHSAILGRLFHPFPPIEVPDTVGPCRRRWCRCQETSRKRR